MNAREKLDKMKQNSCCFTSLPSSSGCKMMLKCSPNVQHQLAYSPPVCNSQTSTSSLVLEELRDLCLLAHEVPHPFRPVTVSPFSVCLRRLHPSHHLCSVVACLWCCCEPATPNLPSLCVLCLCKSLSLSHVALWCNSHTHTHTALLTCLYLPPPTLPSCNMAQPRALTL